jgi:hypothetical protein
VYTSLVVICTFSECLMKVLTFPKKKILNIKDEPQFVTNYCFFFFFLTNQDTSLLIKN